MNPTTRGTLSNYEVKEGTFPKRKIRSLTEIVEDVTAWNLTIKREIDLAKQREFYLATGAWEPTPVSNTVWEDLQEGGDYDLIGPTKPVFKQNEELRMDLIEQKRAWKKDAKLLEYHLKTKQNVLTPEQIRPVKEQIAELKQRIDYLNKQLHS